MIVFVHIPSAAGSTLWTIFREVYGRMNVKRMRGLGMEVTNEVVQQVVESDQGRVSVVGGHVRVNTSLRHRDGVQFVTFLRDPTAIQVSRFLRHVRRKDDGAVVTPEMVVEQMRTVAPNPLTRFLRDQRGFDPKTAKTPVTRDDLERAKETIAKHIHVFGFVERFDESMERFRDRLGWNSVPHVGAKNTASNKPRIPAEVWERGRERNAIDHELYAFASDMFAEQTVSAT